MSVTVASGTTNASRATTASEAGSYTGVRYAAAQLGSGYLLLIGGKSVDGTGTATTNNMLTVFGITASAVQTDGSIRYTYEFRRPTTPLSNDHIEDCQAVALSDAQHLGKVLACGGHTNLASTSNKATLVAHRMSPEAYVLTSLSTMAAARGMHRATLLNDGRVLVAGGFTTWSTPLATCERWTPSTEAWTSAASMATARMDHGQVCLADGRVLVAGGLTGASSYTSLCEVYDPTGNTWAPTGRMATPRAGHALVLLPSGKVLAIGGNNANGAIAQAEIFDPGLGIWQPAGTELARARTSAVYVAALNAVLVVGGDGQAIGLWDVTAGTWRSSVATLARARREAQAMLLPGGQVLIAGGEEQIASIWTTTEHSTVLVPGVEIFQSGGLNGVKTIVTVPSPSQLAYDSKVKAPASLGAGGTVTPVAAPAIAYAGAHMVDPQGVALTTTQAIVGMRLEGRRGHPILTLQTSLGDPTPAARFPSMPGYLVFRYGRKGQAGPVRYLGRRSNFELLLDASFEFPADVQVGDDVTLLAGRDPYVPASPAPGFLYITASPAGRAAAQDALDQIVAGGVALETDVRYPSDVGLGAAGAPTSGADRLSSIVTVYAPDPVDTAVAAARKG